MKKPSICKENKIIITPAAILNSLEKNNKILPMVEAVMPSEIKTAENPSEKRIVFIITVFLSRSISSKFFPVIYEMYPGIIGNTQGDKKLINPAPKANDNLKIIHSLYLPLVFTAIRIIEHVLKIYWFSFHAYLVIFFYKISKHL